MYCKEETSCVLEDPGFLRASTGVCATCIDTDMSTVDISTEPLSELMTSSETYLRKKLCFVKRCVSPSLSKGSSIQAASVESCHWH